MLCKGPTPLMGAWTGPQTNQKLLKMCGEFTKMARKHCWPYHMVFSNWETIYGTDGGLSKAFHLGFGVSWCFDDWNMTIPGVSYNLDIEEGEIAFITILVLFSLYLSSWSEMLGFMM